MDRYREERIDRLLRELQYECERGMMEGDVSECLEFNFVVPTSKSIPNGVVLGEFRTRPMPYGVYGIDNRGEPKLKVVR